LDSLNAHEGFDPMIAQDSPLWFSVVVGMRFARMVLVVPLVEELFWRGFLMRFLLTEDGRFEKVAFGTHALEGVLDRHPRRDADSQHGGLPRRVRLGIADVFRGRAHEKPRRLRVHARCRQSGARALRHENAAMGLLVGDQAAFLLPQFELRQFLHARLNNCGRRLMLARRRFPRKPESAGTQDRSARGGRSRVTPQRAARVACEPTVTCPAMPTCAAMTT
jgi:hypothetical protein